MKNEIPEEQKCRSQCNFRVKKENPAYYLLQCVNCGYLIKDFESKMSYGN